jgi:hypothetical protein
MSQKAITRAGLLKAALAGKVTDSEGAEALHVTLRHFQRLKGRFLREGPEGLPHRSRGRPTGRGLPETVRKKIATLAQTTYAGFNDSHLTEKLREVENIVVGRESVRQIRIEMGLPTHRRRRPRQHRSRRLRAARSSCPRPLHPERGGRGRHRASGTTIHESRRR